MSDEEKQTLIDFFNKKPNLENKIDWNRRDLTYDDFKEVTGVRGDEVKQYLRTAELSKLVFQNDEWKVTNPKTAPAAEWEASVNWCTYRDPEEFISYYYDDKAEIYYVINKKQEYDEEKKYETMAVLVYPDGEKSCFDYFNKSLEFEDVLNKFGVPPKIFAKRDIHV